MKTSKLKLVAATYKPMPYKGTPTDTLAWLAGNVTFINYATQHIVPTREQLDKAKKMLRAVIQPPYACGELERREVLKLLKELNEDA